MSSGRNFAILVYFSSLPVQFIYIGVVIVDSDYMVICLQILQIITLTLIFLIIHVLLNTKALKYCEVKQKGNGKNADVRRSKSEKRRIFLIVAISPAILTAFIIWFFYFLPTIVYNQEPTLYYVIEISSILLGIGGTFFVAYPTSKIVITYWDYIHGGGDLKDKLLENKGTVLNAEFGLILIFYGFAIKLIFLLQQNIF